jgi:long-chain fatty acid transport protein
MRTILAILAASAATAHAGGFAVSQQTAVASGTGGAGVARDDDPGAAWHDPAALADGGGWRADLGIVFARPSIEARALDGSWSESTEPSWATPPHLDVSYARGRWATGVSLNVPFGSGVAWPASWPGRHEITATDLKVLRIAPFAAWRFGTLRVAAGVHADFGRLQIERSLDFIDMDGDVAIDMDGRGLGVDLAAHVTVRDDLAIGAIYRSRTRLELVGGADFTAPDAFSEKTPDQDVTSRITLPSQFAIGARYRRGSYAVLADVELTMWGSTDQLVVDFAEAQTPDVTQQQAWQTAVSVRSGGEWTRGRLILRHGAYLEESPAPADRLAPSAPDSTRLGLTAGASWRVDRAWSVDAFVEAMWLLRRDSTDMDALAASYGGHATIAGLGVRFTP